MAEETPVDPCQPNVCGPYSKCRNINNHAVCSCDANYIGMPPNCHPQCVISSECPPDRSCINQKCKDPCSVENPCARNARCQVINHSPICSCNHGYTGDPFVRCVQYYESKKKKS